MEFWGRCSLNNIESAAGTVKQWKAVVISANGSQRITAQWSLEKAAGTSMFHRVIPSGGRSDRYGLRLSQSSHLRVAPTGKSSGLECKLMRQHTGAR